jgi:hypothetical protein
LTRTRRRRIVAGARILEVFVATIRIPRLIGKTNLAGVTSWYWQPSSSLAKKGWTSRALGAGGTLEDIPDHVAEAARRLNADVDGSAELTRVQLRRIQRPPTLDQAIARWRERGFPSVKQPGTKVAAATARQYGSKCRTLEAWGQGVALTSITAQRVAKLRDALMAPAAEGRWQGQVRHHAAHETLRVGRTLFSWLEQEGMVPKGSNPFEDFALAQPAPRDQVWWQPHRDAVLAAAADDDPALQLAVDLAFSIGQREADLLRLQLNQVVEIPHYKLDLEVWEQLAEASEPGGTRTVKGIRLRQAKGQRWIEVPIVGETRRRVEAQVAAAKDAGTTSLLFDRATGLPWTMPNLEAGQRRFIRRFAELRTTAIAAAAGDVGDLELAAAIEQLQFRDFRRTAVVFLGELGIADHLIAAITGHTLDETKRILETYLPRTTGMAARAIALSQARTPAAKQEQVQ